MLQQYLPFTVLKLIEKTLYHYDMRFVATVLTVYGIETLITFDIVVLLNMKVATVLTVYGIETRRFGWTYY